MPRAKGERPCVRAGLLPEKLKAKDWKIPGDVLEDLRAYALEQGLSALQFDDALADVREKITRAGDPVWLHSQALRFIETRAERLRAKNARARAVGAGADGLPPERDVDVEGEVCELGEDEKPRLPPPLRFKSWDLDPHTRRFTSGKDSEGWIWFLDDERRLRRRPPRVPAPRPEPPPEGSGRPPSEAPLETPRSAGNGQAGGGHAA